MGRRAILLLSAMATMMLVAGGVALAFTFTEGNDNCRGTATRGADQLAMGGGNDRCAGLARKDEIFGDHGRDDLSGDSGDDFVFGGSGADTVEGGFGDDFINVSDHVAGNDEVDCGVGTDRVVRDIDPRTGDRDVIANCDDNFTDVPVSPGGP
jgi:Ca2+-binding RTX toxin-like protein